MWVAYRHEVWKGNSRTSTTLPVGWMKTSVERWAIQDRRRRVEGKFEWFLKDDDDGRKFVVQKIFSAATLSQGGRWLELVIQKANEKVNFLAQQSLEEWKIDGLCKSITIGAVELYVCCVLCVLPKLRQEMQIFSQLISSHFSMRPP